MLLQSARSQYAEQQKIAASAVLAARRRRRQGVRGVIPALTAHQLEAAALSLDSLPEQLDEQGIDALPVSEVVVPALISGKAAAPLLEKATTPARFDRLIAALVTDAGRTASAVDMLRRPALTGYIRSLSPPSCGRCAVLAGRVYRYSTGFQRHPRCDCLMTPTTLSAGRNLVIDPTELARNGQIRGLSSGDMEALDNGADLGQIVNVRRKQAGLTVGSSVIARAGRLTPQGIQRLASDREDAIRMLRQFGYLRP